MQSLPPDSEPQVLITVTPCAPQLPPGDTGYGEIYYQAGAPGSPIEIMGMSWDPVGPSGPGWYSENFAPGTGWAIYDVAGQWDLDDEEHGGAAEDIADVADDPFAADAFWDADPNYGSLPENSEAYVPCCVQTNWTFQLPFGTTYQQLDCSYAPEGALVDAPGPLGVTNGLTVEEVDGSPRLSVDILSLLTLTGESTFNTCTDLPVHYQVMQSGSNCAQYKLFVRLSDLTGWLTSTEMYMKKTTGDCAEWEETYQCPQGGG